MSVKLCTKLSMWMSDIVKPFNITDTIYFSWDFLYTAVTLIFDLKIIKHISYTLSL